MDAKAKRENKNTTVMWFNFFFFFFSFFFFEKLIWFTWFHFDSLY